MNFAAFERAQVAAFAYREARRTGQINCMRAICYLLRNRVKSAWGDGTWLSVIEGSHLVSASAGSGDNSSAGELGQQSMANDRLLMKLISDVDDIYLGQDNFDDSVRRVVCGDNPMAKPGNREWMPALYYHFVDLKPRPWFVENIIHKPVEHAHVGQIGPMMLYR